MRVVVDGMCWLEADKLTDQQKANIRNALTIQPRRTSEHQKKDPPQIGLFVEDDRNSRLGVPREWYRQTITKGHDEVINVSDGASLSEFESCMKFEGRFAEQKIAVESMKKKLEDRPWGGLILKGGCGFGKTNTAMELARQLGRRTLILVHKEFFVNQWRRRFEFFFPGARVGIVRQNVCQFEDRDFVIAMIHSLASSTQSYPKELYEAFGLVISDEVHRVGAPSWSPVIPQFSARYRLGLTATDRRKDGCENVFYYHVGQVGYEAKTKPLVPMIRKVYTDAKLRGKMQRDGSIKGAQKMGRSELVSQVAKNTFRTRQLMEDVLGAVRQGRKIMVLSERLEHLKEMADDINSLLMQVNLQFSVTVDFYTGSWFTGELNENGELVLDKDGTPKTRKRSESDLEKAESANIIFATNQMVQEGLDIQAIDVLVIATPLSDVEQAAGRVRRECKPEKGKCERLCPWRAGTCPGKPSPIITDAIDEGIPQAMRKWKSRAKYYRSIGAM